MVARRLLGEAAPAAADLEKRLAFLQVEPGQQERILRACAASSGSPGAAGSAKIALE